jgi:hypothetical protein
VLYVETEAGTRYTTRSSPDDVFRLDASSRFELDLGDGRGQVDALRTTGSRFPGDPTRELFNPGGCF